MRKVLHYIEFGLSHGEVPGESTLCIYISGCRNRCVNCHYPELQQEDTGERLSDYFGQILDLYHEYITCVCFMGEGKCTEDSKAEMLRYVQSIHDKGYKSCLYSGRDTVIEEWMKAFDYVRLGNYCEECGPLSSKTTNQRMWMRISDDTFEDITYRFW